MAINSFTKSNFFLSNMFDGCSITYQGNTFRCVECAFQAQKDPSKAKEFEQINGYTARGRGRKVNLRPDWEQVKVNIMLDLLRIKFANPELRNKLIATGNEELIEGNTWKDTFWGFDINLQQGQNMLGKLLMQVRSEIQANNNGGNNMANLINTNKTQEDTQPVVNNAPIDVPYEVAKKPYVNPNFQQASNNNEQQIVVPAELNLEGNYVHSNQSANVTNVTLWKHTEISMDGGKTWVGGEAKGAPIGNIDAPMLMTPKSGQTDNEYFAASNSMIYTQWKRAVDALRNGTHFTGDKFTISKGHFNDNMNSNWMIHIYIKLNAPGFNRPKKEETITHEIEDAPF